MLTIEFLSDDYCFDDGYYLAWDGRIVRGPFMTRAIATEYFEQFKAREALFKAETVNSATPTREVWITERSRGPIILGIAIALGVAAFIAGTMV